MRVVAVVEESQRALLVGRVRIRVGESDLQAVAHPLFYVGLQRIVGGDAGRRVRLGLGGIPDVGNAQVDVSSFKSLLIRLTVGQVNRWIREECVFCDDRVPISVVLLDRSARTDRMSRRGDLRLVEGQRNDLMAAEIADVADLDGEVAARLPLNVQSLVHGVRQFVGAVVIGERE